MKNTRQEIFKNNILLHLKFTVKIIDVLKNVKNKLLVFNKYFYYQICFIKVG